MTAGKEVYRRIAELHVANIERGFLATLGVEFLALMYEVIDASPHGKLFTCERDGSVVAFLAGTTALGRVYARLFLHPVRLSRTLMPALLDSRSAVLRGLWDILVYASAPSAPSAALPKAELLSIVVGPAYRGQGLADDLYGMFRDDLRQSGVTEFKVTVGEGLLHAHRFYLRMGAVAVGTVRVHGQQSSVVYVDHLPPGADVPPQDRAH